MRTLLVSALAAFSALPAVADQTEGLVIAFDRVAGVIVLDDKTIWPLPSDLSLPADLIAGDRVQIDFESAGENGVSAVNSLARLAAAQQ